MAIQHSEIADPDIHEPKDASSASVNTVYVADGSGSGLWRQVTSEDMHTVTGRTYLTAVIADISTASSALLAINDDCTVLGATIVIDGAISDDDAVITISNSSSATIGSATIGQTGSAKGDTEVLTAVGNNELTAPDWIEIETDGGSTDAVTAYITVELTTTLVD